MTWVKVKLLPTRENIYTFVGDEDLAGGAHQVAKFYKRSIDFKPQSSMDLYNFMHI